MGRTWMTILLLAAAATGLAAAPQPFDVAAGNPGVVHVAKTPENITVDDVRGALRLPYLDAKVKANDNSDEPSLWTAAAVGLREGTSAEVGLANAASLRAAVRDSHCVGLKLDKIYYVKLPLAAGYSHPRYYNGSDGKEKAIVLPRDFVIDGEVEGKATGGFLTRDILFYTEHSLNLRKVRTVTTNGCQYFSYFINCGPKGVEQFQAVGCVFENTVADKGGRYVSFFCEDINPFASRWIPVDRNFIRHIYVDNCSFHGHSALQSDCLRVTESCRILGSTFDQLRASGVEMSTNNNKAYANLMAYMSCPFYIVGNQFRGVERVFRKRVTWVTYYCGALVENSVLYMLRNKITGIVAGESLFTDKKGQKINARPALYDIYFNGQQLYYANNLVENVVRLTKDRDATGIVKSKGHGIPTKRLFGGAAPSAKKHRRMVRYYRKNVFRIDRAAIAKLWKEHTYPEDGGDYRAEIDYDRSIDLDDVLTINIQDYTGYNIPVADFTFSENVVDAGTGNISGSLDSNQWLVTHFSCDNNVFKAARFSSDEWWSREKYPKREWLFPVRLSDYWGKTSFHVTGNVFQARKKGNIRLLLSKYNKEQGDGHAATMAFRGNKCSQGSVISIFRLCTHPWGRYHPLL